MRRALVPLILLLALGCQSHPRPIECYDHLVYDREEPGITDIVPHVVWADPFTCQTAMEIERRFGRAKECRRWLYYDWLVEDCR